jgi:hypothetical protein
MCVVEQRAKWSETHNKGPQEQLKMQSSEMQFFLGGKKNCKFGRKYKEENWEYRELYGFPHQQAGETLCTLPYAAYT